MIVRNSDEKDKAWIPITAENIEVACGAGVAEGLGAALHGSSPSPYPEPANGFSSTKLPPKPFAEEPPYLCAGRGALNIVAS